jgi:hypothetical protein
MHPRIRTTRTRNLSDIDPAIELKLCARMRRIAIAIAIVNRARAIDTR